MAGGSCSRSSTFRLNLSALVWDRGVLRDCAGGAQGCKGIYRGIMWYTLYRVHFVSETAQVDLKSGRV